MKDVNSILVVDDDILCVEFMKLYFKSEACTQNLEITSATSFHEASELIKNKSFSILVTDIQLTDGSGLELATIFKSKFSSNSIVIGVTGFQVGDIAEASHNKNLFDKILQKPLEFSELSRLLSSTLK